MDREGHTASPEVFQICLAEIKDSFQCCRPTADPLHAPNVDACQKTSEKL